MFPEIRRMREERERPEEPADADQQKLVRTWLSRTCGLNLCGNNFNRRLIALYHFSLWLYIDWTVT